MCKYSTVGMFCSVLLALKQEDLGSQLLFISISNTHTLKKKNNVKILDTVETSTDSNHWSLQELQVCPAETMQGNTEVFLRNNEPILILKRWDE